MQREAHSTQVKSRRREDSQSEPSSLAVEGTADPCQTTSNTQHNRFYLRRPVYDAHHYGKDDLAQAHVLPTPQQAVLPLGYNSLSLLAARQSGLARAAVSEGSDRIILLARHLAAQHMVKQLEVLQ